MPHLGPVQWALGALCAVFIGIAKTGLPGVGVLAIPLMVIVVNDARHSAGWLLPILCTADVFAVIYWRRHAAAGKLFALAPWVLLGLAVGAVALAMPEHRLRLIVGVVVMAMLVLHIVRRVRPQFGAKPVAAAPYGVAAGFATCVANAAGPVMSLYLLSKQLTKEEFVATGAWFFFVINLTKVPIYVYHGLIGVQSLTFDAIMIPAVLTGTLTGRWLVYRISPKVFEMLVIGLTAASTLLLFR